jgi:Zn-dependent peptidase ImmA (M78 family)
MGVRVQHVDNLPQLGLYHHYERLVEIRAGLPPAKERYVLAHEAAHAEMGHQPQEFFCKEQQQERLASAMAGRRLIDHHAMAAMLTSGTEVKVVSAELSVASAILRAYMWLAAPAMRVANCFAWILAPVVGMQISDIMN